MANFQDILKRAIQIRDAVSEGANTASLVGGVMVDTLYNQIKLKQDIDGIIDSLKDLSKSDSSGGIDEITLANYLIRNGYAKKSDIPTSWWGQAKNENNEVGGSLHNVLSLLFSDSEIEITGVANANTPTSSNEKIVTPFYAASQFLSKLKPDTAQELITFAKGLVSNGLAKLNGGAYFGNGGALIDDEGRSILESLQSIDYDNEAEQGFAIKKSYGKYHGFITNLTIWGKAIFNELDVRKLSYAGGNVYLSGSGSKIVKVVPVNWKDESSEWIETSVELCEGWLCYLLADDGTTATQNLWREGDQVRCKTIGTLATGTMNASNKSYWRTIPANGVSNVNEKIYDGFGNELYGGQMFAWIVLGKHSISFDGCNESDTSAEIASIPEAGDTIVLDGSRSDVSRQGVLILESTGENTPRIVGFKGVNRYTHKDKDVFVLSPDGTRFKSSFFKWVSSSGEAMHMVNYRGEWQKGLSYSYYDQVSHGNGVWLCTNSNGSTTEPKEGNADWQLVMKAEKGEKGDDGVAYQVMITSDTGTVMINGSGEMTLKATLLRNGEDISDTISNSSWSWWRQSADAEDDAVWNTLHEGVGRSCLITRDDVSRQAQFGCRVYISEVKTIDSNI